MVSKNLHNLKDGNYTAPAPVNDTALTESDVTFVNTSGCGRGTIAGS